MKRAHMRKGFTIIEVMVVLAIIAILLGLVAWNVVGKTDDAKVTAAKMELDRLQTALDDFKLTIGRYPSDEEGLEVLWSNDALSSEDEAEEDKWQKFLKKPSPNDVWGNPWEYTVESEHDDPYDLWSVGPDGEPDTEDDIVSWYDEEDDAYLPAED